MGIMYTLVVKLTHGPAAGFRVAGAQDSFEYGQSRGSAALFHAHQAHSSMAAKEGEYSHKLVLFMYVVNHLL